MIFRKTVVMDINLLPMQYKKDGKKFSKELLEQYEKDFNVKIVPYDGSPQNAYSYKGEIPRIK